MVKKIIFISMMVAVAAIFTSCGGSSTGGSEGGANVDTLASIPSLDLSQYDSSASASANLAKSVSKSASKSVSLNTTKAFGNASGQVGTSSRAGCEQNMHKQEVFRMSQMAQLDRCYPEAMEKVGLIAAIPTGSYAYYRIAPPDMGADQKTGMCDDIPAERTREKENCLEQANKGGSQKLMLMRLGKIDSQLQIDMCQGSPATQVNSATYGASGSLYNASVVRIGSFGGETESGSFSVSVDIGTSGKVENNVVTIGENGYVSANGQMNGKFGSGSINFERATDSSVKISGAFAGAFEDPFSGTRSEFTGKTYARVGGTPVTGCAKFSFTGTMPAMKVSDMIPFNISQNQLSAFLQTFGAELGIELTLDNYRDIKLCPNPDFNPDSFDPTIKPMLKLADGATSCGIMTDGGTECFNITNAASTTDFGTETSQIYAIIANASAPQYTEVNAFDLSTLSPTISAIVFTRSWDCTGTFTDVDFASVPQATVETEMRKCFAIEEKARNNGGMGNESQCEKGKQMDNINDLANGGGGQNAFGAYGGEFNKQSNGTCLADPRIPEKFFVDSIDADTFCVPQDGRCSEFNIVDKVADTVNITIGNVKITRIQYNATPATGADITFLQSEAECTAAYDIVRQEFNAPGEFGGEGEQIPQPCIDAGLTGPDNGEACHQLCMRPGTNCRG